MSTHTGSHVDAPLHVHEDGATTDDLPLSSFLGPVRVVVVEENEAIKPGHLPDSLSAGRVLFKTPLSDVPDDEWPEQVPAISPEAVEFLGRQEVDLVGTDAPSVDPLDSTSLPAHDALRRAGITHLEGLCLNGVPPGMYQLVALPLKITKADAAPIRAVLRESSDW